MFRQTALMQVKLRTNNNNRTAGIVHAFAEEVLAENTALAFEVVG